MSAITQSCTVDNCEQRQYCRKFCQKHYVRYMRHGSPNYDFGPTTPETRFLAKVDKTESCWLWTANTVDGYGVVRDKKRLKKAHRRAYELWVGDIPNGLHIDHLCNVRRCVNPAHLEAVTQAENNRRRSIRARSTVS